MKTKTKYISLALALLLILSLAACGSTKSTASNESQAGRAPDAAPQPASSSSMDIADAKGAEGGASVTTGQSVASLPPSDKIIYSGYAELETLDFEKTLSDLQSLIKSSGAFIENSNVTGGDYASMYGGDKTYRSASYTIRVPVDKFTSVTDSLKTLGNVVNSSTNAQNITMQYTDTQSRLDAYRVQETRLLELLAKASSVEDMIKIENSLSELRYQIESLTSQLKNWDSQVSYSSLSISIREVALYSKDSSSTVSYSEQIKQTFTHSLYGLGSFFKGLLKFIVAIFPALVVFGVIALIVLLIVRAANKRKKAKTPPAQDTDGDDRPPFQQ